MSRLIKEKPNMKSILLKVTLDQYEEIKTKADEYTGGNVTEWLKYASRKLEPRNEDLVDEET